MVEALRQVYSLEQGLEARVGAVRLMNWFDSNGAEVGFALLPGQVSSTM
jgi:hypothetical protein